MIKTILVPLDGSSVAEQGLAAAFRVARETGATLLLVRAVVYVAVEEAAREGESHELREARAYLGRVQRDLEEQGRTVVTEVLPVEPVRAILFAAAAHDADLISICTHSHSGVEHALLGSVAEAVLRRSATPILLTRAGAPGVPRATAPFGRILVPLDGTAFAETALSYLRDQGIGRAASLLLLRAIPTTPLSFMPDATGYGALETLGLAERETRERRLEGDAYLRALGAARLADGMWDPHVVVGDAGEAILDVAEHQGAELIALATHGRHGWDRLLHGSVTRHLLRRSTVPMLILPGVPADAAEEGEPAAAAKEAPTALPAGQIAASA